MKSLTRKQALSILSAVVDDEATNAEKRAFFEYIKEHSDVRREYENAKKVKFIISKRCPRKKAPEHLKRTVLKKVMQLETVNEIKNEHEQNSDVINEELKNRSSSPFSIQKHATNSIRYIAAAAVLLFISLVILQLLDQTSPLPSDPVEFVVENMTAQHFLSTGGAIIEPHFATHSIHEAEGYLLDHYGMNMSIPEIKGAEFAGIVMADFLENFQTPLFEYTQPDLGETIYIFVFDIDSLNNHKNLQRDQEAVKNCVRAEDFYVAEIDGYHVVSWLWNNTWYSAISNHNGYDLAALIEPLNSGEN
jgi:hypothetical protein